MIDDIAKDMGKDTLKESIGSTSSAILSRLNSSLIVSFSVSWLVTNYEFLMILFSKNNITTTLRLIDTISFPTAESYVIKGVLAPLAASLFYCFILPSMDAFVYRSNLKTRIKSKNIEKEILGLELLSRDESADVKSELDRVKTENSRLRSQIADMQEDEKVRANKIPSPEQFGRADYFTVIKIIASTKGGASIEAIEQLSGIGHDDIVNYVDTAVKEGYIQKKTDNTYSISNRGRIQLNGI